MAGVWCFTQFLLLWFVAFFPASESRLVQVPEDHRPAGVFLLIEGGIYTFNFTAARDACRLLNVTIATREQMQRALQQGLETCKFGWIAEQVAVIPRLTSDTKCGQGKTGLVPWRASPDRKFGVFCFSPSDSQETASMSTAAPHTSTSSPPTLMPLTQTSAATTALVTSPSATTSASSPRPTTTESTERTTTSPPVSTVLTQSTTTSTTSSTTSSSSSMKTSSTRVHASPSHHATLKPTKSVSAAFSTSVSELQLHVESSRSPLGALPTTLIVLCVVLLLLTAAAGAAWYHRPNILTFWSPGQHKDDTETEMWKHVDSEMDLHSQHGAEDDDDEEEEEEEEYEDRKYSSDITLCVKPDMKTM